MAAISEIAIVFVLLIICASIVTGPVLILKYLPSRRWWRLEPGEWLALALAWGTLILLAANRWHHSWQSTAELVIYTMIVQAIPFGLAAIALHKRPWWCGFFLMLAGLILIRFVPYVGPTLVLIGLPLALVLLITTLAVDESQGELGSWLHWCGVMAMVLCLLVINALVFYPLILAYKTRVP